MTTRASLALALLVLLPCARGQEPARPDQAERAALARDVERLEAFSRVFRRVAALARPSVVSVQLLAAGEVFSHATGVIVDGGAVLTNHHVLLEDARVRLRVVLHDGRALDARVVGRDPMSDLALLRLVAPPDDLVPAVLGDSDAVQVGDWVVAVGSPFGLDQTVTAGIVSAKERAMGLATLEDFLQTDAALNPGSSGGPLLNLRGEVIGINTAIASGSGASAGVGFAIPSAIARHVALELAARGRVTRGWLGVAIRDLTPAEREAVGARPGVAVTAVAPGGPAERAGLRPGDVILTVGGEAMREPRRLRRRVATTPVGAPLALEVWRAGAPVLRVDIAPQAGPGGAPAPHARPGGAPAPQAGPSGAPAPQAGPSGAPAPRELPPVPPAPAAGRRAPPQEGLGLYVTPVQGGGLRITTVEPGSLAARAGLRPGWSLRALQGRPVTDAADLEAVMGELDLARGVRMVVESPGGERRTLLLRRAG